MEKTNQTQKPMMESVTIYVTPEQKKEMHERAARLGLFVDKYIVKKCCENAQKR